ncbi:MAG: replicative DNA helicase [Cyanobacteria bacterium M5B4]|nr:MAG: replicative DNA helicase [Cyanobacteria bacterium M5B4]
MTAPFDRPPPYDLNAERATLGSVLLDRDAIVAIAPSLTPSDFYLLKHGQIYEAMLACYHRRTPPDLATVISELRERGWLEHVGGIAALTELASNVPTAVHVEYYARAVQITSRRRQLITAGGQITALAYDEREELEQTCDKAEQTLFAVTQQQRGAAFTPLEQSVERYFNRVTSNPNPALATGLNDLDALLGGGLQPGNLLLLAARPGMGKTGLALSIAHHITRTQRTPVAYISLEMGQDELVQRLIAIESGVNMREIAAGLRAGTPTLLNTLGNLSRLPLHLDDSAEPGVLPVRSRVRHLHAQQQLGLVILDYLQLLVRDTRERGMVEEVSHISRQLKLLARELNIPVLALSQLSRAVESRAGNIPQLSDLRDSGSLEQDADVVLFIYRDELYHRDSDRKGIAELYIAKHRNGPTGMVPVHFHAPTTRFANLAR